MPRKKPRFGTPLAEVESLITSLRDELATLPASIEEGSDALARVRERFQGRILAQYDEMIESDRFVVMDGTLPVNKLQKQMRQFVKSRIDLARFAPKKATRRIR